VLTDQQGRQLAPWALEKAICGARDRVDGLPPGFRYRDLRPYLASLLIASGADVKVVQARLRTYTDTMLSAGDELIAEELRRYGEEATAAWVLECSDDDLIKICSVADWLLHYGPRPRAAGSMIIAKACALAAVYVRENAPRDLARARRGKPSGITISARGGRRPDPLRQVAMPNDYAVGNDAREFWARAD
jgi:hypothetical protein